MRKKLILSVLVLLVICLSAGQMTFSGSAYAAPLVILDGQTLYFDVPPTIENGRTLVPLRVIFEALGADVKWDGNTQTVTATKGNTEIKLVIGGQAYKNGQSITLDVPAKIIGSRTMVPLRFTSEALGCQVGWNGDTETITITSNSQASGTICKVSRVIDGDTIEVNFGGKFEKVRLIGVDTPETVHLTRGVEPYGQEASNFTKEKLTEQQIRLETDVQERDQYGRLLAYVWLENQMFNELIVREGYAKVATYPPNVKYVERFTTVQKEAREAGRGLWGSQPVEVPNGQSNETSGMYVGSSKSDKYHNPSCKWAENIKPENKIWFKDANDALSQGYKPCGVCKP